MIGYTVLGVTDLDRARGFYDDLLGLLGAKRVMEVPGGQFYGFKSGAFFAIRKPFDGNQQHCGNGNMIALNVGTKENVHAMHARALALGGVDEGAPGPREAAAGFYGGYFRDLDGNKLCAYTMA
jgi:catechol 2,3-dioxygenase-like lactoylglutathione lyase family enzyme